MNGLGDRIGGRGDEGVRDDSQVSGLDSEMGRGGLGVGFD